MLSPLARAADTGRAFLARTKVPADRVLEWEAAAEMRFGDWDNMMVSRPGRGTLPGAFEMMRVLCARALS